MPVSELVYEGSENDHDHLVPADLLELYEVLEWNLAVAAAPFKRFDLDAPATAAGDPTPGTIVSRAEAGLRPPKNTPTKLTDPDGSTAHYEGPKMGTFPHSSCATKVRGIQAFHMDSRGWNDIAYTTIVCPHGVIFMGRGWGVRTAANGTNDGNARHYAHCVLIGVGDEFTGSAQFALKVAFRISREQGKAGTERKVHSDWKATACPGDPIRDFVRAGWTDIPAPEPGEDILSMAAQNADDARRTLIVGYFLDYLGRDPEDDEINLHVWVAATAGLHKALLGIARSTEAVKYRTAQNKHLGFLNRS
jgi:hypothetical protein